MTTRTPSALVPQRLLAAVGRAKERSGGSQNGVARHAGISSGTLSSWLNGVYPPSLQGVADIARLAGVTTDWIVGLSDTPTPRVIEVPVPEPPEAWADFRKLDLAGEVGAGPGRELDLEGEGAGQMYAFRASWFGRVHVPPHAARIVKVAAKSWGESMLDTIHPGALLAVDGRQVTPETLVSGDVYLVWRRDEGMVCKRVFMPTAGTLVLWSDNARYTPRVETIQLAEDEPLHHVVRAHVVWRGQELLPLEADQRMRKRRR